MPAREVETMTDAQLLVIRIAEYVAGCSHPETRSARFTDRVKRARVCTRCGAMSYEGGRWNPPGLVRSLIASFQDMKK